MIVFISPMESNLQTVIEKIYSIVDKKDAELTAIVRIGGSGIGYITSLTAGSKIYLNIGKVENILKQNSFEFISDKPVGISRNYIITLTEESFFRLQLSYDDGLFRCQNFD